jgi:peptide/nickel transport system substrate-binding protein
MLQTAGSFDPEVGSGLRFRFGIGSPFSGVKDPQLDQLIASAVATFDPQQRDQLYLQAASYLGEKAYAPFLVAQGPAQVTRGIHGPGLTTRIPPILINTGILWQDVWVGASH